MGRHPSLPPRVVALGVLTLGALGLAWNEWRAVFAHKVLLIALVCAPTATLLGLIGLWDPRVVWALGPHRGTLPTPIRTLGIVALVAGILVSIWLAFARYHLLWLA